MQRVILLLTFLAASLFSAASGQTNAQAKETNSTLAVRKHPFDLIHLSLDLRFDWNEQSAYGTCILRLIPTEQINELSLDAAKLDIQSAKLANTALKFSYNGSDKNDALTLFLGKSVEANKELTITITYRTKSSISADPSSLGGTFGNGLRFMGPTSTDPILKRQIWSHGDPIGNRYWFPGYDWPNDLRTTDCKFTVDKELTAISNGELISVKENADNTRTFHWKMDRAYPNHLTSVVAGEYREVEQEADGIPLISYSYPDEVDATLASVERLPEMVRFFNEVTGVNYPFTRYSQVFVQDYASFLGNATVSTITDNMVDDFGTHADFLYLWDLTEAEALAQQWFGNLVTVKDWRDTWLTKSFAHHLNCLFDEHRIGNDEFLLWVRQFDHNSVYLADWSSGVRRPVVVDTYEEPIAVTGDNYASIRGSLVLSMLRGEVGEEKWKEIIREFCATGMKQQVTTNDFKQVVNRVTKNNLNWFFDQWLYRMGHPFFEISQSYDQATRKITLTVKQVQTRDTASTYPQTELFAGSMNIAIDDRVERVQILAQREQTVSFTSSTRPHMIQFDHGHVWIKEVTFAKSPDELLHQFRHDTDILGKQEALNELATLASSDSTAAELKSRILDAMREEMMSQSYWRFRTGVMASFQGLFVKPGDTTPAAFTSRDIENFKTIIARDSSWVRVSGIRLLGLTRDKQYADLYLKYLSDKSDRVVSSAAQALGRSKDPRAFDALVNLIKRPSWKSQSLINALLGLRELGDPRGYKIAYDALASTKLPHWTLSTPVWDYRLAAAQTIASLGKSEEAYPVVRTGFDAAMNENDLHGTFYHAAITATLAPTSGQQLFDDLRVKYAGDEKALAAVALYENQYKAALTK